MIEIMLQSIQISSSSLESAVQVAKVMVVPGHFHDRRHDIAEILLPSGELLLKDCF